jgi:hypothetical protein
MIVVAQVFAIIKTVIDFTRQFPLSTLSHRRQRLLGC